LVLLLFMIVACRGGNAAIMNVVRLCGRKN
jgi:hypothetical protein